MGERFRFRCQGDHRRPKLGGVAPDEPCHEDSRFHIGQCVMRVGMIEAISRRNRIKFPRLLAVSSDRNRETIGRKNARSLHEPQHVCASASPGISEIYGLQRLIERLPPA